MEYKQGEILDEYVAPASSRFITSHDQYRCVLKNEILIYSLQALTFQPTFKKVVGLSEI